MSTRLRERGSGSRSRGMAASDWVDDALTRAGGGQIEVQIVALHVEPVARVELENGQATSRNCYRSRAGNGSRKTPLAKLITRSTSMHRHSIAQKVGGWARRDSNPHCQDFKSCASAGWATGPVSGILNRTVRSCDTK